MSIEIPTEVRSAMAQALRNKQIAQGLSVARSWIHQLDLADAGIEVVVPAILESRMEAVAEVFHLDVHPNPYGRGRDCKACMTKARKALLNE